MKKMLCFLVFLDTKTPLPRSQLGIQRLCSYVVYGAAREEQHQSTNTLIVVFVHTHQHHPRLFRSRRVTFPHKSRKASASPQES